MIPGYIIYQAKRLKFICEGPPPIFFHGHVSVVSRFWNIYHFICEGPPPIIFMDTYQGFKTYIALLVRGPHQFFFHGYVSIVWNIYRFICEGPPPTFFMDTYQGFKTYIASYVRGPHQFFLWIRIKRLIHISLYLWGAPTNFFYGYASSVWNIYHFICEGPPPIFSMDAYQGFETYIALFVRGPHQLFLWIRIKVLKHISLRLWGAPTNFFYGYVSSVWNIYRFICEGPPPIFFMYTHQAFETYITLFKVYNLTFILIII